MQLWYGLDPVMAIGAAMLLAITAYAVLGGADFGGGIWDLLATGPRASLQRQAIARAMGPVWEANHVWLIFVLVILFTAFPVAFGALSIALFGLFHAALAGIVLRGAAFVFRANTAADSAGWRTWASVFGAASIITPFLLGTALGAVSSGGIRLAGGATVGSLAAGVSVNPAQAWFSPVSLGIGALTLALMAYLAAVFLTVETEGAVQEDFRVRALGAGVAVALLAAALLPLTANLSPLLWQHLSRPQSAPPMLAGALLAAFSAWAVGTRRYKLARGAAVAEVVIVLWGWAFAQWPYLIYPDVTVYQSAAALPTIKFVLDALPFGFALLIPSLWFLFAVFKGHTRV
ncbi:MAG TPA: cytochrome d ubiquinol oxidase subunit II [Symbiobacteriaceae bacterium]|jgi:cytochrome d ubiquinol oxidase subunit II